MLTMLAEQLIISIPNLQLIQINTDGLTCKYKKVYQERYDSICKEWEKTTKLTLEYADYSKMIIRDVNNYTAIYTNGKTKCKGDYEFENLPLHKNKSALITRIAAFNYFVHNIPIEDTIKNHKNILDFCIGIRAKQDAKLISINKKGEETILPKTIRYFISNTGTIFKKRFADGRISYLNVHPQKGRSFYQTLLNEYEDINAHNYDINYSYYVYKTKHEIETYNLKQIKLFQ